ncbi:nucleoside recognition domain-containing protein [Sellimonas intestinalis]|uniref:nucleoside recognition domain-containing protein n=1 Tax=Sellimonas intestinalis TaxID=1653434 RepID=UPI0022E672D5|nr:nucleoside recognition domain-containing protein [Sellimonas intestinalis]
MLNSLWAGMILIGIIFAAFTGRIPEITDAALDSSKEAVTLCITMIGVMAFWMGLMEIASKAGMIEKGAKMLKPFVRFLFPEVPEGHKAGEHITTNIIANFLGLGWAATPAGLKAMEELGKLNHGSPVASTAMCTSLILSLPTLQLTPVNVIAFRSQYGSVNPTAIVGAGIVATAISTGTAIVFCKIMDRKKTRKS